MPYSSRLLKYLILADFRHYFPFWPNCPSCSLVVVKKSPHASRPFWTWQSSVRATASWFISPFLFEAVAFSRLSCIFCPSIFNPSHHHFSHCPTSFRSRDIRMDFCASIQNSKLKFEEDINIHNPSEHNPHHPWKLHEEEQKGPLIAENNHGTSSFYISYMNKDKVWYVREHVSAIVWQNRL